MPWHKEAMKDAVTGDTPRWGGSNLIPADFRMGQPFSSNVEKFSSEYIGWAKLTQRTETSKYLEEDKTIVISLVVASERETAKTIQHVKGRNRCVVGVVGCILTELRISREVKNYIINRMFWKVQL